jgi:hypothetical protein
MGVGNTSFLRLRPVDLLKGTFAVVGSVTCEVSLCEDCEGPPNYFSFESFPTLPVIVPPFLLLASQHTIFFTRIGLCIFDCGVGAMFILNFDEVRNYSQLVFVFLNSSITIILIML